MKKLVFSISLILSYTFIAIAGVVRTIPAKADDIIPYTNQPTITPTISDTDRKTLSEAELFIDYLRHGGQVDFSNSNSSTSAEDFLESVGDIFSNVMGYTVDVYNWAYNLISFL